MATKVKGWVITLRKCKSTWYWFTQNPQGGGGGSNQVSSKKAALASALRLVPSGQTATVLTKDCYGRKILMVENVRK